MLDRAMALEADYLATGHYARIIRDEAGYKLWRAKDDFKDQSYVLYMLGQNELSRLLFPLGDYTKDEVRKVASEMGLPVAQKLDSADICFVPDGDYRSFVSQYVTPSPGHIVDTSGRRLGDHEGIADYTIGQRRGLGVASKEPLYVIELRPEENRVVVGSEDELLSDTLWAEGLSFVSGHAPTAPTRMEAKGRYRSTGVPATLTVEGARARVQLDEPVRAVTPGQAVVFYQGDNVLGGGIIASGRPANGSEYVTSSQSSTF
jgi:tRNA-specific 2-thiouridylase